MRLVALTFAVLLALPAPARAADGNDLLEAVKGLEDSNVFIMEGGELANEDVVRETYEGSSVAIVVLPEGESLASYDAYAENLERIQGEYVESYAEALYATVEDDFRTVIVLSDSEAGVASNQSTPTIESLLAGTSAQDSGQLVLAQERIEDVNEFTPAEWVPVVGGIGLISFFPLVLYGIFEGKNRMARARARRQKAKSMEAQLEDLRKKSEREKAAKIAEDRAKVVVPLDPAVPDALRGQLSELGEWTFREVWPTDPAFANSIRDMIKLFSQLFARLDAQGNEQQARVALVGTRDMLVKITAALSDRYYSDIKAHPDLWDSPDERIEQVKRAVEGVRVQLVASIKRVNASQDLDFHSSLASLASVLDAPTLDDLYGE